MPNSITMLTFLILFSLLSGAAAFSSNETDLLSLLAFKSALQDSRGALDSWKRATSFCSWKGIQCGTRHPDRVVGIDLSSQGVLGSLSPHVGNLSLLRWIFIENNNFSGPIPQEVTLLRRLQFIDLSYNSFSGAIPKNLSQFPKLVYFNMLGNNLSGNLPEELGALLDLELLDLSGNTLSGPIPPSIGNLTSLKEFGLVYCSLEGEIPETISQLRSLIHLLLSGNSFTGFIPSGLFNISTIQTFELSENQLHGTIPSTIGLTLPNLKVLYLEQNQFTGSIPVSISNASFLEQLVLSMNSFTGPMPRVGMPNRLQVFVVEANAVADDVSFISSLTNCTNLVSLMLGGNQLYGSLPDSVANFSSQLNSFRLSGNKIHGGIPSGIENLINIGEFVLADNYLDGQVPHGISKLSKLRNLDLQNNRFSNKLDIYFVNLTLLSNLYLNENSLTGDIPSSLASCTNLIDLDLSCNNFAGLIPPEILSSLPSLSLNFNLSYNAFHGGIPYEVGSLINLGSLDLSNNRLSGQIPSSLSACLNLETLHLNGNFLQGEIPLALNGLVVLQDLDLSENNLSGTIPEFLGSQKIEKLNLSFNRLYGEVPVTGVFKNETSVSLEGNDGLCGGIPELKLPPCPSSAPGKKSLSTLENILIPAVSVGGICLTVLALLTYRQRYIKKKVIPSLPSFTGIQIMRLSYLDLLNATDGFSEANLLGFGRFGSVYKGILGDGHTEIAVKVLNLSVRGASRSFAAECSALRNARHRNLLKILSVCESIDFQGNEFKALVYEFKVNGSLEKWLHRRSEEGGQSVEINMIQRLNIAIDIAEAVEYLHFGTDLSIVHGDLKPSNILLDQDMIAFVGDFGLAKIISDIAQLEESINSSTGVRGTIGYLPPEYGTSHLLSTQGDVYSYGIILLELFTNKRPTDDLLEDDVNLHSFVSGGLQQTVMEVVDSELQTWMMNNDKIKDCMRGILSIGVSCSNEMPRNRMSMTDVVIELRKIQKLLSA